MKERHWNSLVTSLRHGQCILVLGPEIPVPVLGDGVGVVDALTRKLSAELEDDNRRVIGYTLAAVAQQFEDTEGFGSNALRALAEKFYKNYADVPSAVHRALASLPFLLILTTCHDALLFEALQAAGKKPLKQRYDVRGDGRDNSNFFLPGSPESPIIYHMFGDVEEPRSLILSENDLLDFLIAIVSERPPLPNSLVRALKRPGQSFLFIGLGVKQWYLRVLLKVIVRTLELHRTASAIATEPLKGLSEVDREQTIFFYQRGTRIEFEDEEIESFLAELTRRVHAEGGFAGRAITLGPRPRVFLSYAREDSDLAARLYDALLKSHFEPWLDTESLIGGDEWDRRIQDELEATDFTLVLYTPALCRKADSYVNKEIALARSRALSVRGSFLIPLRTADIALEDRVRELGQYQEMPLRPAQFDEDLRKCCRSCPATTSVVTGRQRWPLQEPAIPARSPFPMILSRKGSSLGASESQRRSPIRSSPTGSL